MANFFENLVGNFEDTVQYNKDNRAFEGATNTNVTIETLCDIMTGKTTIEQSNEPEESPVRDEKLEFPKRESERALYFDLILGQDLPRSL